MIGAWHDIGYFHRGVSEFGRGGLGSIWQVGARWIGWWRIIDAGFPMALIENKI